MKPYLFFALFAAIISFSSCTVVAVYPAKRNPPGWTKNTNNPHHPATTNPGHTKHRENPSCKHH